LTDSSARRAGHSHILLVPILAALPLHGDARRIAAVTSGVTLSVIAIGASTSGATLSVIAIGADERPRFEDRDRFRGRPSYGVGPCWQPSPIGTYVWVCG